MVAHAGEKIPVARRLSISIELRRSSDVCLALCAKHMDLGWMEVPALRELGWMHLLRIT